MDGCIIYYAGDGVGSSRFSGSQFAGAWSCNQDMGEKKCEQRRRMGDTRVKVEKLRNERGSRMRDTRVKVETIMIEKRLPNKRCQSESQKVKMWKEGDVNFLFSVYLPTCTVVFPSCTSFHLSLFILLLWHFPFLCLLFFNCCFRVFHSYASFISSFTTFTLLSPVLQHFSFLHFSTIDLVSPIQCLFFTYIFLSCLGGIFMLQQPVCFLYLPWELVTSHPICYTIMHLPVAWYSSLTEWSLGIVLIGGLETWLTNYQCMLCNIPEKWRGKCWLLWLG